MKDETSKKSEKSRDNFSSSVVEILKKRAGFICSNPSCKAMTIAPSGEDENKVQYIGVAAHITAASEGGPRFDKNLTPEERCTISNAIFLCGSCSIMIDKNNGIDYKVSTLNKWKSNHEKWILQNLNKSLTEGSKVNLTASSKNQLGGITANIVNLNGVNLNPIDEKKNHDKNIFDAANKIFSEDDLKIILDSLLGDESIWSDNQDKLEHLKMFFEKSSNDFITETIENSKNELLKSLRELLRFLGREFDMFPYNQPMKNGRYRACMQPTLNVDRLGIGMPGEHTKHIELYKKLREVANKFEEDYKAYRKSIKTNLFI